jgi:transcriptional regulator with XRE-family HTH domain
MENEEIAKKVRETRKLRGLTQSDIANVLDKTAATVSDIERGKIQISAADLFKIANALNKPIEFFYGDEFGNNEIQDLVFIIRKQSKEQQAKIIQQTKMILSLGMFQEVVTRKERELSDQEIGDTLKYVFQYADEIEKINKQMSEIKKNLRESLKSQGIDENTLLGK